MNQVGKRLLSYLNETIHYRIRLSSHEPGEDVLCSSKFGKKSWFLGKNPLDWKSSRQQLATLYESRELSKGTSTRTRRRQLRLQLHIDNQAAFLLATRNTTRANYVREKIQSGGLNIVFEPGLTQRADLGMMEGASKALDPHRRLRDDCLDHSFVVLLDSLVSGSGGLVEEEAEPVENLDGIVGAGDVPLAW